MQEILQYFNTTVSTGGRPICKLRLTDGIDTMGSSENELQDLTTRLEEKVDGTEVSSEKSKVPVNSTNQDTHINITMNDQNLDEVDSFNYIGFTLSKNGN